MNRQQFDDMTKAKIERIERLRTERRYKIYYVNTFNLMWATLYDPDEFEIPLEDEETFKQSVYIRRLRFLNMPKDYCLDSIHYDFVHQAFAYIIYHETFNPVILGDSAPQGGIEIQLLCIDTQGKIISTGSIIDGEYQKDNSGK